MDSNQTIDLTDDDLTDDDLTDDDSRYAKIEDSVIIDLENTIKKSNKKSFSITRTEIDDDIKLNRTENENQNDSNDENATGLNDLNFNYSIDYDDDVNIDLNWTNEQDETMIRLDEKDESNKNDNPLNQSNSLIRANLDDQNEEIIETSTDDEICEMDCQSIDQQPNIQPNNQYLNDDKSEKCSNNLTDDDEITELDNELSVLFVRTPQKLPSKTRNYSTPSIINQSPLISNSPMFITNCSSFSINQNLSPSNEINKSPSNEINKSPSNEINKSPSNEINKSPSNNKSATRFTNLKRNLIDTSFNQEILIGEPDDDLEHVFDPNKRKLKRRTKLSEEEKMARQMDKQTEKERKRHEKDDLRRQKEKLKDKQRKIKEASKYLNLRNSAQFCTSIISQKLIDQFLTSDDQLIKMFEENKLNFFIDKFGVYSQLSMIRWKRTVHSRNDSLIANKSVLNFSDILSEEEVEEDQLVFVLSKEHFVKMVYKFVLTTDEQQETFYEFNENDSENQTLISFIVQLIEQYKKSILFIVCNLESYYRSLKNREHRDFIQMMNEQTNETQSRRPVNSSRFKLPIITRTNVEESILNVCLELMKNDTAVELKLKVKFQFVDNQTELINLIVNLSKSMAESPFRKWRNSQEGFDWFVDGDCKTGSVNLKELPIDANRLWLKHLLLFDKISMPIAKSIVQKYANLMSLKDEYDSLIRTEDKESLLTKIVLNESNRKINLDISRRIYRFLTETNEDEMLV